MPSQTLDQQYMHHALSLAGRGLGRTWPNPSVGCVIVKDAHVIAAARTGDGGRPHAEAAALEIAGAQARGATAYVSLEPCAHHGKTGPCAAALVAAGVARVVIACGDPDPRVSGEGVRILSDASIEVIEGVCEQEALALNAGFFKRITQNRPLVTLKMAVSGDDKIARAGQRTQISGEAASRYMHLMRARHDAILVGVNTALTDDPMLSARIDGHEHKIMRCVMDRGLRLPVNARLVQSAGEHSLVIFHASGDGAALEAAGARLVRLDDVTPAVVLASLAEQGITRLMVEGGAQVASSFLNAGLVDEFHLIRSHADIGADGVDAIAETDLNDALQPFDLKEKSMLGEDVLEIYAVKG